MDPNSSELERKQDRERIDYLERFLAKLISERCEIASKEAQVRAVIGYLKERAS